MKKEEYFNEIIKMMKEYWKLKIKDLTYDEMKDNYLFMKKELKFVKHFAQTKEEVKEK